MPKVLKTVTNLLTRLDLIRKKHATKRLKSINKPLHLYSLDESLCGRCDVSNCRTRHRDATLYCWKGTKLACVPPFHMVHSKSSQATTR